MINRAEGSMPREVRGIKDTTLTLSPSESKHLVLGIINALEQPDLSPGYAYDLNQVYQQLTGEDWPNYKNRFGNWSPADGTFERK